MDKPGEITATLSDDWEGVKRMNKTTDRFNEAVKNHSELETAGANFFEAAMNLSKEIAKKGAQGESLSDAEIQFVKSSTLFFIQGLLVGVSQRANP